MHWLVYGAGAVGGVLGARMHDAGLDVTLVARGVHLAAIRSRGLTVAAPDGERTVDVPAVGSAGEADQSRPTTVLLAVKSHQTHAAVEDLVTALPDGAPVVSLQNGVANEPTLLRFFSDVQDPGDRRAVLLDDAGLEVPGRHHHADPLHVGEEPQQGRLVGHAVLQRHHRRGLGQRGHEVLDRGVRLVALDREQHRGRPGQVGLPGAPDSGYVDGPLAVRGRDGQPAGPDRREVVPPGHQRDVEPRVVHPGAEDAADRSRAVHEPVHGGQPASPAGVNQG